MFYMRRKTLLAVGTAIGISLLAGCTSPARVDYMAAPASELKASLATPLRGSVSIGAVSGGRAQNAAFRSHVNAMSLRKALETSLLAVGLFSPETHSRYRLSANILGFDQPEFGVSITSTAIVKYELLEKATGNVLYKETIAVPYTATFDDAVLGDERLRLANEGTVRMNISKLVDDLFIANVKDIAVN